MAWEDLDPMSLAGLNIGGATQASVPADGGALHMSSVTGQPPIYHPDNPVFWFGVLMAFVTGLVAVHTHVKVGPFRVSGDT